MGDKLNTNNQDEHDQEDDAHSYHHYSFTFDPDEVSSRFADVRLVFVAGCALRAEAQARYLADNLISSSPSPGAHKLERLTKNESRFILFKLGPVLVGNHGMGGASLSIALHEIFKMCRRAGVLKRIILIRFGTCGGIGIEPGTLCITNRALDSLFQDHVELKICLKLVRRPCVVDQVTARLLERLAREQPNEKLLGDYQVRSGATVTTNDFYEEQGRSNGAICEHTREESQRFLAKASELGVINMEMESNYMAAMCHKLGVSFGVVCVSMTNRLSSDEVELTRADFALFKQRLFWLNLLLVRHQLAKEAENGETSLLSGPTGVSIGDKKTSQTTTSAAVVIKGQKD